MDDFGLNVARVELLEQLGRSTEAADLHLAEGRILTAIKLYLIDESNVDAVRKGCLCLLDELWRNLPLGFSPTSDVTSSTLQDLLHLTTRFESLGIESDLNDEVRFCHC